ncbi:MAG: ABC transporter permease [Thermodesulfobacteria bacterium]|nr:ABC transporter permease [Thermodesulfobacteriota bacterium]
MRLKGLIWKETKQIVRDPSSIGIAFFLPVALLLIFGYGVSLDAEHVPIGIVIEQPGPEANDFAAGFRDSDFFDPVFYESVQDAEKDLIERKIMGLVWTRSDFARTLLSGTTAPIGVIVNGVDANQARIVEGYITGVWIKWLSSYALSHGKPLSLPVNIKHRIWFNSAVRSRNFLVPGLVAVIMTLIGGMLTSMVVAREWERGTMEALLVTPVRIREIILSKVIPYFILGMGGMLLSVYISIVVFDVPFRGSYLALGFASALFMLTAIALGLIISTAAGNQFVAGQIAIVITFLPAFMLSGFVFDINSMPVPIQVITYTVSARYFVSILQTLFLAGDIWPIYLVNCLWLAIMAFIFFLIIKKKSHKRLI